MCYIISYYLYLCSVNIMLCNKSINIILKQRLCQVKKEAEFRSIT